MNPVKGPVARDSIAVRDTAAMLARAFHDDPPSIWFFPDEKKRRIAMRGDFTAATRYGLRYGDVYVPDESPDGAAIWLPPGNPVVSALGMLRVGFREMASIPLKVGFGYLPRYFRVMRQMDELHKRDVPKRHWYLMVLGVEPERQGQGVGSALIGPGLARADGDRLPCYLETSKEINVVFYKKHGFEVLQEVPLGEDGPLMWTMLRQPVG
ncbi:MAG: GNAT family N-acetyltransferase [Chloroflexi bacterium]|nr:MAG: GNAT family N-acetyltransferase [Chloroflexota bacterium]